MGHQVGAEGPTLASVPAPVRWASPCPSQDFSFPIWTRGSSSTESLWQGEGRGEKELGGLGGLERVWPGHGQIIIMDY